MAIPAFTAAFLLFLGVSLAVRIGLSERQVRCVRAHRDAVPVEFSTCIDHGAHQRAADYTIARVRVDQAESAAEAALLFALTLGGGVAALARLTGALPLPSIARDLALVAAVAMVTGGAALPFAWWRRFRVEARFGFNRSTQRRWLADVAGLAAVAIALGVPLTLAVLWLMDNGGATWWLMAWIVWVAFQVALVTLYPALIAPLFNRFTPLVSGTLRERIEALLARCRFGVARVFVVDGSRRSSHGNAWFAGLGATKRVVLFDTLLDRLAPDEVEAVVAHELGHYRLHHVAKRVAWSAAASLAVLALLGAISHERWFLAGLGIPLIEVAAMSSRPGLTLALFVLALPVFTFALTPLASAWSRRHEFEADAFAARHASAPALVAALSRLYADNGSTLTPDPLYAAFHESHPPAAQRIARLQRRSS